ncbi:MAG: ATP-binding protein [Ignavibacteriaceae bacterium]|jgi:hypothetical protein|nr:ATP-binding protein [Ignavibacteriaceae bacterium]MCC6636196.1 ATP-binding protein [Ignavibacteriaceae bacterium]
MKKLPLGIQTFSLLIEDNLIYVDKTKHIINLIDSLKYVFLSRPRRFGKSLLLSTIEEFFLGKKELFKGLDIYDYPEWKTHPIIRLDFSNMETGNEESFRETLFDRLNEIAAFYGIKIKSEIVSQYFGRLIKELSEKFGQKTVILIDEYDKPITDHLDDPETAEKLREFLKSVFVRMKGNDAHIRFVLLTGVSKFSKVSLFSGMNQITDISMNEKYASLLGYTQEELELYFPEYIEILAQKKGTSKKELLREIKHWYNGYSWDATTRVYNPFSILSLFQSLRFDNYWFSSGTPSHLIKLMKEKKYDVNILKNAEANILTFDSGSLENIDPVNLLFQTGYLTVSQKRDLYQIEEYLLNFPNFEVETSFYSYLIGDISNTQPYEALTLALKLRQSLEYGYVDQFESILRTLFAQIPANLFIQEEKFYHSLFIMIAYLCGVEVEAEVNTNIGRIDGVIEFSDRIYIIEFKYNHPAEEGLKQIARKKYYEKFLTKGKPICLVGASFIGKEINTVSLKLEL